MKASSKEEFVEVFEEFIETLIKQQAELEIEIHSLIKALEKHRLDSIKYYLEYFYDEDAKAYHYNKVSKKRMGF